METIKKGLYYSLKKFKDDFEKASVTMMEALKTGNFVSFEDMLDNNVKTTCYYFKTLHGIDETLDYWKDWRKRQYETGNVKEFKVVISLNISHCCLVLDEKAVIMFHIRKGKIYTILLTPINLTSKYSDDNMLNYPLDYRRIKPYLEPMKEPIDDKGNPIQLNDRIPCMDCGLGSLGLKWYKSKRPDYSYRYWEIGEVSVCPQCGRVVEYLKLDNIEATDIVDSYEGLRYQDIDNVYYKTASKIYSQEMIDIVKYGYREEFVTYLLSQLVDLELDAGCSVEINALDNGGQGDISQLYVYDEDGNKTADVIKHLKVRQTEIAAWQLYLLHNISTVLPTFWHGEYNRRKYIFKEADINDITPLKYHDLTELFLFKLILPTVTIEKQNEHNCRMIVGCSYWNEWNGLLREEATITIKNNHVIQYDCKSTKYFDYNCGIFL